MPFPLLGLSAEHIAFDYLILAKGFRFLTIVIEGHRILQLLWHCHVIDSDTRQCYAVVILVKCSHSIVPRNLPTI